jgi:hypothetical protein
MIVWGGDTEVSLANDGGRYNPATNSWVPTYAGPDVPDPRWFHTAVWTGSEMIVWGGDDEQGYGMNSGGRYLPAAGSWMPTSTGANCPSARAYHVAFWTGTEMIVWGQQQADAEPGEGGRYNPVADSWIPTSTAAGCPSEHIMPAAVWTGTEMVVWGGASARGPSNEGGRYNPASDTWTPTSTGSGCPTARWLLTSVWTGQEMIVWGGAQSLSGSYTTTGGRYSPAANTWVPTSTEGYCPSASGEATALWTGNSMIVYSPKGSGRAGGIYTIGQQPSGVPEVAASDLDPCSLGIRVSWPSDPADWRDGGGGSRTYRVLRNGAPLSSGGCAAQIPFGSTQCTDAGTSAGASYQYQVRYVNACGLSSDSAAANATDILTPLPGAASSPSPADGAADASNMPTLTWAAVAEATSYDVYLGSGPNPPLVATVTANVYATPELLGLTTYSWKVTPKNICGPASDSPTWSFTTVAAPQVTAVKTLQSPFRLKISGTYFEAGAVVKINGQAVPQTAFVASDKLVAKKGSVLKAMVPKGVQVCIGVANPDGGVKACFAYTR